MPGYDANIPLPQGAIKLSEIFADRTEQLISTGIGASSIILFEQMLSMAADTMRRQSYILNSTGDITWSQPSIFFNADGQANNIQLTMLQTDDPTYRTVNFILQGSLTTNDATHFLNINMNDGDLLYLELDWAVIQPLLAGASGNIILNNAVGGGSAVAGYTVRSINLGPYTAPVQTNGIPQLNKVLVPAAGSTTFFIPLAWRRDTVVASIPYQNMFWIPHGIRWPNNVSSQLGAVIVEGFDAYPEYFASSEVELTNALTILGTSGGVICIVQPFSIASAISVPDNVMLLGRSPNKNTISFSTGGSFVLGNFTQLVNLGFSVSANFGSISTEYAIQCQGQYNVISGCQFTMQAIAAWSSSTTYAAGAIVQYTGNFYVSLQSGNTNNNPYNYISNGYWYLIAEYSPSTTYPLNALVYYDGSVYESIQAGNMGNEPDISPLWWTAQPYAAAVGFVGNYNKTRDCRFVNVLNSPTSVGVLYVSGNNNSDYDSYQA